LLICTQDFFYVCPAHLKDKGFCSPIINEAEVAAKKKKEMEAEVERVKQEFEEKQRKKNEKEKEKEKEKGKSKEQDEKDDEKDEKDKKPEKVLPSGIFRDICLRGYRRSPTTSQTQYLKKSLGCLLCKGPSFNTASTRRETQRLRKGIESASKIRICSPKCPKDFHKTINSSSLSG
jgi:hypothetical protein